MPKINVLPKEVYSLIAAGEVVERPMSIVKEMIENSIDAGAKHITVEIKNGGTTYIRITDDGCGIAGEDVKKVFISHATSKISTGADLDSIATLGFRGEAMASIAAVAKVELLTKAENEEMGVRYEIAGGEELDFSDAGCPQGTTVVVRDIFFNVPARMKFLKKDVTEGNSVQGIVERIAISNPDISFRFIREGRQAMITAGNGDLKSTIYSVYGSELSETLVPVEYHYSGMRLTGYVSRPHQSRKSRAMQFFFINGRLVDSRLAKAALEQAYKNLIMVGRFPACVLNIEMDTKLVDVNVHPAKIEVRFVNEKPIFDLIYYGVKTAVEQQDTVKEGKLSDNSISSVYGNQIKTNSSKIDFFKKEEKPNQLKFSSASPKTWSLASPKAQLRRETSEEENIKKDIKEESVFDKPIEAKEKAEVKTEQIEIPVQNNAFSEITQPVTEEIDSYVIVDEKDDAPVFRVVGEAFRTYIIVEIENDLYYIDKHAAHERMNFEKLKAESNISSQLLLMPVAVKLSAEEYSVITDNIPLLSKCGFEVEDFGNLSVIVRETPSMLDGSDIKDLILEIAEKLLRHKTDIEPDKMDWIFHSTACRSAVKGGDYTSEKERELFVEKLLSMPDIRYCPHGRPVMIKISRYELEKQFGRIQ
ncbi:MAG: DNA mismatch repair endonuclease MutL [Eubacterium sp.]|nr:DNA mismatch repair endonuclease MutL [Eubacterium sp.]